jgi:hypothetical protein
VFGVDFTLAEARSRLAALDIPPASSSPPLAAAADLPAAVTHNYAVPSAAANAPVEKPLKAAAPSVSDVRKDMAAKRRMALQQATQSQ